MEKLVVLYLKPYWYSWCLGVLVQDKVFRTNFRNRDYFKYGSVPKDVLLSLVALPLMMTYAFFIPITLIYVLPSQLRNPLSFVYIVALIAVVIYLIGKRKSLRPYFQKPKFLEF